MKIEKKAFGVIPSVLPAGMMKGMEGKQITNYILKNENGMSVEITEFGACIVAINVPDKTGKIDNVILSYNTLQGYLNNDSCFGALVGRCANRVKDASFTLNGETYHLLKNDGKNNLHSTVKDGYWRRPWTTVSSGADDEKAFVKLHMLSPDLDQGFPGNLEIHVTYTLNKDGALSIHYKAKSDKDTIVNLTNHSHFNLGGESSGPALNSLVWIDSDYVTKSGAGNIPTGTMLKVAGTPFDFNTEKAIGRDIRTKHSMLNKGYDCNYVLKNDGKLALVASMRHPSNGRKMEVYTDLPGIQLYSGNYLSLKGNGGRFYKDHSGICFETQFFPDAIHHEEFPSPVLKAGKDFFSETIYKFTVE